MNGIDFFVDTNFLIYTLVGKPSAVIIAQHSFIFGISVISEIELLGKKNISLNEINIVRNLLNDCEIIGLNNKIKDIAIMLRQKFSIKTPDAIVAATAKSFNLPLLTFDKDFKKLEDVVDVVVLDLI